MSAANAPIPSVSLDEERRAHEPSMEEILASIRRIIADDDRLPADAARSLFRASACGSGAGRATRRARAFVSCRGNIFPAGTGGAGEIHRVGREDRRRRPRGGRASNTMPISVEAERFITNPRVASKRTSSPLQHTHDRSDDRFDEAHEGGGLGYDEPIAQSHDETVWRAGCRRDFGQRTQGAPNSTSRSPTRSTRRCRLRNRPLVSNDAAASISAHFQALAASTIINDSANFARIRQGYVAAHAQAVARRQSSRDGRKAGAGGDRARRARTSLNRNPKRR